MYANVLKKPSARKPKKVWNLKWWREAYYSDFQKGIRKIQIRVLHKQDRGSRQEAAAWIYELVRRLPGVREGDVQLPGCKTWPSFIQLPSRFQAALVDMVEDQLGYRPIFRTATKADLAKLKGYSDPVPSLRLDLKSDNKKLIEFFLGWINDQRAEHAVEAKNGEKGFKSHNRRELPKKPDWKLVELLDHEPGQGIPLSDAQRARRRDAKACA